MNDEFLKKQSKTENKDEMNDAPNEIKKNTPNQNTNCQSQQES